MIAGCAVLTLLDQGQSSAWAQSVSAADFAAPNPGTSIAASPPQSNSTTQTVLLVNPVTGDDSIADGSDRAPFRTITQALQVAPAGTVILLSPGTYSQETGERFPLRLKPDVTVQGNSETRGQGIVIQGSGFILSPAFARQKVAILGADRAILSGVTVQNPDPQGYGVWIESTSPAVLDSTFTASGHDGISIMGSGSPLIRNNYFYQNGANGMTIYGTSQAEVRENIFEQTGFAININQKATPLLVGNRITQNKDGIVVQASAQPILRNNSVDGNQRDGLVAIAQSRPNLGTTAAPGGNSFRNNGQFDINTKGSNQQIPAFGNDLDKTSGQLDLAGTSVGTPATSGSSMPWSTANLASGSNRLVALSVSQRSPASADKSTGDKNGAARAQKGLATPSTLATTSQTISFGQRLEGDQPVAGTSPASQGPAAATSEAAGNGISAASFPAPVAQPAITQQRPVVPLVAMAAPNSAPTDPGFPVPAALTGISTQPRPRTVQVVRIAAAPPMPSPRAVPVVAESFNANLPLTRASARPRLMPVRSPIALTSKPVATLPVSAPLPALKPVLPPRTGAIEIPVPAPEVRSTPTVVRSIAVTPATVSPTTTSSSIVRTAPTVVSAGLLPVPNPDAPIGNVGGASIVYRAQQSSSSSSSSTGLKLPYRVVVDASDSQQTQIRTLFPNAFRTSIKGRSLMQVGAFSDRSKADQLMQTLSSQGVQAIIETLE
ncbi:MAG: DUF1565 domain-containing protein [Leptolyngbya sp. BL-A-14]